VAEEPILVLAARALVAAEAKGGLGHVGRAGEEHIAAAVAGGVAGTVGLGLGGRLLGEGVRGDPVLRDVEWRGG
jgi:hypothetical protein